MPALRNLYFVRFAFAIVWAAAFAVAAASSWPLAAVLLVAYPAFDVVAAVVDRRSAGGGRPSTLLVVNIALSVLTAIGLAVAAASGQPAVLRVWGAWAITAGAVQLAVGVARLRAGGQWPMVLSGGISVLAGAGFVFQARADDASVTGLAGYAVLGGVFFLVSALRMRHTVAA